jgi:predicted lactoylglutathione lyase
MSRFHVHTHVQDLQASIRFYSQLFGAEPARVEADYAKWMLDDPRLNFAISTRSDKVGVDHFGMQADSADELAALRQRAAAAGAVPREESQTTCCYARSDKHWITDPQGIAWEHFHTLADIPVFSESTAMPASPAARCCPPRGEPAGSSARGADGCC